MRVLVLGHCLGDESLGSAEHTLLMRFMVPLGDADSGRLGPGSRGGARLGSKRCDSSLN